MVVTGVDTGENPSPALWTACPPVDRAVDNRELHGEDLWTAAGLGTPSTAGTELSTVARRRCPHDASGRRQRFGEFLIRLVSSVTWL